MRFALFTMMTLTLGCAGSQDVIMAMDDPPDEPQAAAEEQPGESEPGSATEPEAAPGQNAVQTAAPVPLPPAAPACDLSFLEQNRKEDLKRIREEGEALTNSERAAHSDIQEFLKALGTLEQTVPSPDPRLMRPEPLRFEVEVYEYPVQAILVKNQCVASIGSPRKLESFRIDYELTWSRVAALWMIRYAESSRELKDSASDDDYLELMWKLMGFPPLDYSAEMTKRLVGPYRTSTDLTAMLETDQDLVLFTQWLVSWLPDYAENDPKHFRRMVNLLWKFSAEDPPSATDRAGSNGLIETLKTLDPMQRLLLQATLVELSEALGVDAVVVLDRSIEVLKKLKDAEMESGTKLARLNRLSEVLERSMQQVRSRRQ